VEVVSCSLMYRINLGTVPALPLPALAGRGLG